MRMLEEHLERDIQKDLIYVKKELITKQPNGKYMKFSRALNAVSIMNIDKITYISYWKNKYKQDKEECDMITSACLDKFENDLIDNETMIKLLKQSNDTTKDKDTALELLVGE